MRVPLLIFATAVLAGAGEVALAADRPSIIPTSGERASYLWTATRHSPVGTSDSSAAVVLRGSTPPGTMQVAITVDGDDHVYVAKSRADGSLDFVATRHETSVPELTRLDQISRLAGGAGRTPVVGDSWKVDFDEPVAAGTIVVTVLARVTSVEGGVVSVEAEGDALGTIPLPQPEATPNTARPGSGGFPGGGGPPGGNPGNGPSGITGGLNEEPEAPKESTMSVKVHLRLSARFAGTALLDAQGSQVASPLTGVKESIETDWSLTKA